MIKDDVALALNHIDQGNKVTDIYIEKDWSIVDEVQSNVLALLFDTEPAKRKTINPIDQRKTMCLVIA
jgi:hypothetical protein